MLELENIILSVYDSNNEEHNKIINKFEGESKSQFIHSIRERLVKTNNMKVFPFETGFFVNIDNNIVGYLYLNLFMMKFI